MEEIHLTKKDFRLEWFSGTGGGGQYRNKHQNCCRITHIETGLMATGQSNRERPANQKEALENLARLVLAYYEAPPEVRRELAPIIRNYHAERNEVLDKSSGLKQSYKQVVVKGDLSDMIDARKKSIGSEE